MLGVVSGQLEAEICLHGCTDVGGPSGINAPAAVFILMLNNPVCGLPKALGIARPQQGVKQNIIRLERGVSFEFSAPVAFLVLRGEKELARGGRGSGYTSGQAVDLAEAKLWLGG